MESVLNETKVEKGTESRSCCAGACCERIEKGVSNAKDAVSEMLEDGKVAAERLLKRSRYALEDGIEKTAHNIKRHPFSSVAIGFAAGTVLGFLVPRIAKK